MLSLGLILLSAIIFPGIISLTKAKMSGRKGNSLLQPMKDIVRLMRKGSIYSTTTSWVFQFAPTIYLVSILGAMLMIPFPNGSEGLISFKGDFLLFAYLLGFGKFLMIVAALDTGSGFEGMGANREALYSMLVEPAFFILIASLTFLSGFTSFHEMFTHYHLDSYAALLYAGLAIYVVIQITMIENSRMPVDDPKTHLELTMVHEVMVLDNSGFDLGLIQIGSALKFTLYGGLIANLLLAPFHFSPMVATVSFFGVEVVFAIVIGLLESFRARIKMIYNPQYILTLSGIAILAFFTVLIITHKIL